MRVYHISATAFLTICNITFRHCVGDSHSEFTHVIVSKSNINHFTNLKHYFVKEALYWQHISSEATNQLYSRYDINEDMYHVYSLLAYI